MNKRSIKKQAVVAALLALTVKAQAQATGVSTQLNQVWSYVQVGFVFIIVLTTLVGGVVVYNAKSSADPNEFKKKLMGFIYGILFLIFALGIITVIKSQATNALNGVSF